MIEITRVKYDHPLEFSGNKIDEIIKAVCAYFDIKPNNISKKSRNRTLVIARQICAFLIRTHRTDLSLLEIANILGYSDHTTIIYNIQEVRSKLTIDIDPIYIAMPIITSKLPF